MSKKDKKAARQQQKRLEELQRQEEEIKAKNQLEKIKQQEQTLRKSSSPLVEYGLLDAYEFFLKHLAQNGIPQPNIFQFAAQAVLKYQKRTKRKGEELKKIEDYNKSVIEGEKKIERSVPKRKVIKPSMLPFKGEIDRDQLNILDKIGSKNKSRSAEKQNL